MKIALCFKGLAEGTSKANAPVIGFKGWDSIKKHVCQDHDFDVFAHSWSTNCSEKIIDTYNPKIFHFEEQKIFADTYKKGMEKSANAKKNKDLWGPHIVKSQVYSTCKSIMMKQEYERKNGFSYDAVFVLRYDSHFWGDVDYDFLLASKDRITYSRHPTRIFKTSYKGSKWWSGVKIWDIWWGGSTKSIDVMSHMYDFSLTKHCGKIRGIHPFYDNFFRHVKYDPLNVQPHPTYICELNRIDPKGIFK